MLILTINSVLTEKKNFKPNQEIGEVNDQKRLNNLAYKELDRHDINGFLQVSFKKSSFSLYHNSIVPNNDNLFNLTKENDRKIIDHPKNKQEDSHVKKFCEKKINITINNLLALGQFTHTACVQDLDNLIDKILAQTEKNKLELIYPLHTNIINYLAKASEDKFQKFCEQTITTVDFSQFKIDSNEQPNDVPKKSNKKSNKNKVKPDEQILDQHLVYQVLHFCKPQKAIGVDIVVKYYQYNFEILKNLPLFQANYIETQEEFYEEPIENIQLFGNIMQNIGNEEDKKIYFPKPYEPDTKSNFCTVGELMNYHIKTDD